MRFRLLVWWLLFSPALLAQEQATPDKNVPFSTHLKEIWAAIVSFWEFQLTEIDGRPITIGKLLLGIVLLILGIWFSRLLSRTLGQRILRKIGLNDSAIGAFTTLSFYLFILVFSMLTLELVNVPLTVFTLLGGALAIGIGFGSQNLMNNFISGLIILAERPVRIGDHVQVGGVQGTIQTIGARSTRIRTSTNLEVIVPNSTFLQEFVTNWTLSDSLIRTKVVVGVAYGSPIELVRCVLLEVASAHERILPDPAYFVIFENFGDNALTFQLHFWIMMQSQTDRMKIESDIRFAIDKVCREHQITIAFPQRDVHLDTLKPLEIRLLPEK